MATYKVTYTTGSDEPTYMIDGEIVDKAKFDSVLPSRWKPGDVPLDAHMPGNWPLLSDAAGCHPKQVGEAMAHAKKVGVPTEYTPEGQAVFTSQSHRKAFLKAHNMRDRNGCYGDT